MAVRDYIAKYVADLTGYRLEPAIRETEQLEKATDSAADEAVRDWRKIADATADASRKIDRSTDQIKRDTTSSLGDAGREAGDEFAQNLGESISSGDVSGLLSGTVGGLVGTFGKGGPIALALGALGAVGVGVFTAWQQSAEKAAAAAQLAFDQLREGATREAKLNAVLEDRFGSQLEGWEQLQRYADASGKPVEAIAEALADGGQKARDLADQWERAAEAEYKAEGAVGRTNALLLDGVDDMRDRADALERAAAAAETERDALRVSEGILRRSAAFYAARGSAYAPGGSVYRSQVPYAEGKRD